MGHRMTITIKTGEEIEKMRVAGRLAGDVLHWIRPRVKPGITTDELDKLCHDYIVDIQKAIPAPLNYKGFPKSICTSVNHQVCHGIPGERRLKNGDIVNIDVTVIKDGYHGDTSKMFLVGEASISAKRIARISHECMVIGIEMVKPAFTRGRIQCSRRRRGCCWCPRHPPRECQASPPPAPRSSRDRRRSRTIRQGALPCP